LASRKSASVSKFTWEPKSANQQLVRETVESHVITFVTGPAGTGKTAAAVYTALEHLDAGRVSKIVVSRPLIEVGRERVGLLPGNVDEKIEPYLAPIESFLKEYPGYQELKSPLNPDKARLETAPVAFMRGRTFNDAFILIDEAQNLTRLQMFTVLTRIGKDSRMVLTGDLSQCDLPEPEKNGLIHILGLIEGNSAFGNVKFDITDVLRSDIVGEVIRLYSQQPATTRSGRRLE
jgi:phosphate starvation-inducible PhoH-like protein